jgi:hypothetical protein
MNRTDLARKLHAAALQLLRDKGYISATDVLMAIGRLSRENYERWRFRQVPHLEKILPGSLNQHAYFIRELRAWAQARNLKPSRTAYMSWGKGRKQPLRFTKFGQPWLEESYSTHFLGVQKSLGPGVNPDNE